MGQQAGGLAPEPVSAQALQEVIGAIFPGDRGAVAVAREDFGIAGERQQLIVDRLQDLPAIAAGKIGAADAVAEEGIAGDEFAFDG